MWQNKADEAFVFLDFLHFKQTGKSVTGLDYFTWERGPVPKDLFLELDKMEPDLEAAVRVVHYGDFRQIVPKKKFEDTHFTNREKELMERIAFIYKDVKADEISEISHLKNEPWHRTLVEKGQNQRIDYLLSIDDADESLSYDEAKERMEEIGETQRILGIG